jgi:hypothetical protein
VITLFTTVVATASDHQKAQKELNKITALATDLNGRRVVNFSMAETLKVSRASLNLRIKSDF